ncbi:Response regulator MprA [Planktothrix tepida]|uniref:Response regulator receiver protein n=2 Tax=Planktothrix TaxID=54304 RepID=A0A1J1LS92_9CYAN|nr:MULTISPECIES: response regulator [Planktothrix]CAD5944527.1 Response regulator MprA [Planktothrix pseudagardhii]CAD5966237.1 Response regulator MprA [Planktothrix tepida]CUR35062.1 Response regulator receiver protein [Planktothrix tepida PCC 9214]
MYTPTKPKSTILAVDDSIPMQKLIKQILENHYHLILANNTIEALTVLHQESIDLMLLDISMPGIDGLELCRILRGLPNFNHLPIIMLTARDEIQDQVKGKLSGATEYLTKPFCKNKLIDTIDQLLNSRLSLQSTV